MISPSIISILSFLGKGVKTIVGIRHVYKEGRENSLQHRLFKFISRFNKHVKYYAISDYTKREWVKYSKVKENNCSTIYNSIPKKFFEAKTDKDNFRAELGIPKSAKVAVYVGRYAAYKGLDIAFDALKTEVYKHNLYLLFIGHPDLDVPGTSQMLKRINSDIDTQGLRDNIRFLGVRNDIDRVMASSDVLVHPTRTEAFGRSLAEALAAGLPVVATNVEAVPEVLSDTHSILVPVNSALALRNAVVSILTKNSSELASIKSSGRARAEAFGINKRAQAMIDLFNGSDIY
jgi:glycosyltransferase involved in cell wall biosynthesis